MTVCRLGKNKMKISLTDSEMRIFFGGYSKIDYSDPKTRIALNMLLHEALPDNSFIDNKGKTMIEIKSVFEGGCEILLTRLNAAGRQQKRIYVFEFNKSEDMLLGITNLYSNRRTRHLHSSLYKMPKSFRLVITANDLSDVSERLNDYECTVYESDIAAAYTDEYGKLLIYGNAVERLGKIFFKDS